MTINNIISEIELVASLAYQEEYDNSGLITGQKEWNTNGVLFSLDCTEEIVDEAIRLKSNLIVAHHPIVFSGLKKLNGNNYIERTIIKAIKNDIAIYACHTNMDNVAQGVNKKIADRMGLINTSILCPKKGVLKKLVTYVPETHHQKVLEALFNAGAGQIGNYTNCSFNTSGSGTFKGNEQSKPFVGVPNELSSEKEIKIETIFESAFENTLINALKQAHPYEEVAFDIYQLQNTHPNIGSGMIGYLKKPLKEEEFLKFVKETFKSNCIKHTAKTGNMIEKIAFCGGSGRFLLKDAIKSGADAYITADFKYHEFFDVDKNLILIDVGHFESEQFTPEIFYDIIQNKFPTFAIHLSKINTNPINYF